VVEGRKRGDFEKIDRTLSLFLVKPKQKTNQLYANSNRLVWQQTSLFSL
jgi:hypothetical protein